MVHPNQRLTKIYWQINYSSITPVPLVVATPPIDLAGFELRSLRKHYVAGMADNGELHAYLLTEQGRAARYVQSDIGPQPAKC